MKLILFKISSILFLTFSVYANNFDLTVTSSSSYSIDVTQDGEDNDIDFDMLNMNSGDINFSQIGNDNTINIDVDGRTSNGSSITVNQSGNNKTYTGNLWCGHTYCTLTVNQ